jgi:hypothetical protein
LPRRLQHWCFRLSSRRAISRTNLGASSRVPLCSPKHLSILRHLNLRRTPACQLALAACIADTALALKLFTNYTIYRALLLDHWKNCQSRVACSPATRIEHATKTRNTMDAILVPNSQPDSQMSNATVPTKEAPPQTSFSSAADSIATPPSSQSPAPQEKPIDTTTTQTPRISPSRPYTPSLEVPNASQRAGSSISSPSSRSSSSPTRGTKRTANGLMKMTDDAAMASPGTALGSGRRESVSSSSGRINEVRSMSACRARM